MQMNNFDPFGSMNGFMNQFQAFAQNPVQYMMQRRFNIPQNIQNDPKQIQQYMLNSGMINQNQMNWAQKTAQQIQKNPSFQQMFSGMK